jgi:DNA-binding CsgD family transcriptional regulator
MFSTTEANNNSQLRKLAKLLIEDECSFYKISNHLPFIINLCDRVSFDWKWCNKHCLEVYNSSFDNLPLHLELVDSINKSFYNYSIELITEYLNRNESSDICGFYLINNFNGVKRWTYNSIIIIDDSTFLQVTYIIRDLFGIGNIIKDTLNYVFEDESNWIKFDSLSKREKEVLKLLSLGKELNDISEHLERSPNTIRKHKENIYKKIGTNNHISLVKFAEAFSLIGKF